MRSNKMLMKQNNAGFTLVNVLIVIAVIAILSVGAYPVFSTLIEKSWEAADISSVRSAFDHVSAEALMGNKTATVTVDLKQKQADWQSMDPVNIRGMLTWSGEAALKPQYPFDTDVKDYFSLLYNTDFWKDGSLKTPNFEFDSRCPGSKYIPSLEKELEKLNNSLLQQENCTWAFLGNPYDGRESERYLFWTSLNTNKVGGGVKIPVIIQTGDGKYYVSHTTTGERENQSGKYIAVSKRLYNDQQYKSVLKAGEKYDSLTAAYVAYLLALEEYEKSALDSN